MGAPILLVTAAGLAVLGLGLLVAWLTGRRLVAFATGGAALAWAGLYGAALLAASLGSRQEVLAPGAVKRFCGFYLDCHMGVAVERVRTMPRIGDLTTDGAFAIVTLRIESNALRATLRLLEPTMTLEDALGTVRSRSRAAEEAWRAAGGAVLPLDRDLPAGGHYFADVIFEVPAAAVQSPRSPLLRVTEGYRIDRVIELFVIGDEDSFLHAPTLLALPRPKLGPVSG